MRIAPAFLALLVLAGCGSSPKTRFFTLGVVAGRPVSAHASSLLVQVAAVHIPPSLDRDALAWHAGANTMHVSERDRWVAPLALMTRRVLTQDLAACLPDNTVILPGSPAPARTARIVVTLDRFGPNGHGQVELGGSWSISGTNTSTRVIHHDVALSVGSTGDGRSGMAAAMSTLLGRLAQHMAATIARE